jgi:hypothetical protein
MVTEAKRVKTGTALNSYAITASDAINQIKAIKTQLVALKQLVNSDSDYTVVDEDEVQAVIDIIVADIASI